MATASTPNHPVAYWILVAVLLGFGMLAIFSIGLPFLLLGLTLAIVAPWRHRPTVLWPTLDGVLAFIAGVVLTAPLGCTTSAVPSAPGVVPPPQTTDCPSAFGLIHYHSQAGYIPALIVGVALAALAAATAHRILARPRKAADQEESARRV
ncbi:MAG: hypothetical protein ACJ77A_14225 [Actinomycetota bacterium]